MRLPAVRPAYQPTVRLAPSLGRFRDDCIQTAAELRKVLKESPVRIPHSKLPRRPIPPQSAQQLWQEDRKVTGAASSPFSDQFSWRTVSEEQKQKYKDMAVKDVIRFKKDYDEYCKIQKVTVTIQQMFDIIAFSQKEDRGPAVLPKRGYLVFHQQFVKSLGEQKYGKTIQQLAADAAKAWSKLTEEEKDVYREEAEKNRS